MEKLYVAVEFFASWLRVKIRKDSLLRNILRKTKSAVTTLRTNPINRRRWESNCNRFESVIERYSRELRDFLLLQIGACDGVQADPVHAYVKKFGWRGILVEPQKSEFERLKVNYRGCNNIKFENVAIAKHDGQCMLYKFNDANIEYDWQRMVASLIPKVGVENQDQVTGEMVECITFDTLLRRHEVDRIDLLQIDVEGYDWELIQSIDFCKIKPTLIRYEHRHLRLSDKNSCKKHLIKNGYHILEMEYDTGAILQQVS